MKRDTTFDLNDLTETTSTTEVSAALDPLTVLKQWAEEEIAKTPGVVNPDKPMVYDIETGPRPEEELRGLFHEKTPDEFAATCDKRWKAETVDAKYEEYKVSAWQEFVDKAALSPVTGRVLLIGMMTTGDTLADSIAGDEAGMLTEFWSRCETFLGRKQAMIGHNSNSFDLPFLVRRSWYLGVPVPREVRQGRYWHPLFKDTMEWWSCTARDSFTSLNVLGAFFGLGQKTEEVKGGDFHRLWFGQMDPATWGTPEEQRKKAIEYNGRDLELTAAVAAKMGMF